ncbi:nucleotidyltransferase activity protein [[Candida] boidinii]|nr:nucleotidyltransferase activity protein [[Candida] boidinii]
MFSRLRIKSIPIYRAIIKRSLITASTRTEMSNITPTITLNETETKITDLLKQYTNYYNSNTNTKQPIVLRITGGWVRDKLLGHECHDIDIGIDHLSGVDFAEGLKEYVEKSGNTEALKGSIYKIEKNPDKSKHLETCTTKIYGFDIDFVNLRSESYTEESRIPSIEVGTPEEDALRRDATLNALFYNLSTMEVEDLTSRGLQDLKDGILRTPLEPEKTFLDDPLRCLRLIRFASNYNFKIEENTKKSMSTIEIKKAASTKVSRERVGVELKKLLMGSNPLYGLQLILDTKFYDVIFSFGDKQEEIFNKNANQIEILNENLTNNLKKSMEDTLNITPIIESKVKSKYPDFYNEYSKDILTNENFIMGKSLSLILNHWNGIKVNCPKPKAAVSIIVLEGIKLPLKLADLINSITSNSSKYIENLIKFNNDASSFKRSDIAHSFVLPYGNHWLLNLFECMSIEIFRNENDKMHDIIDKYYSIYQKILQLKLDKVYLDKLLVDGKSVLQIFGRKPGPWIKPVNDQIFDWQLNHPEATRDECIEYIKTIQIE